MIHFTKLLLVTPQSAQTQYLNLHIDKINHGALKKIEGKTGISDYGKENNLTFTEREKAKRES